MIGVDTNILVYAHREDSEWHDAAYGCVAELAEGRQPWAIPWPCLHEFLAIVTHPKIYAPPTPLAAAIEQVEAWLEAPTLALLSESGDYWPGLRTMIEAGRVKGQQVHDARIAALCLQHGVRELWSADRDFGRFPLLRTTNPLVDG
ncbi:MAG TPA: TA system VapC family ribonuclease toxin [Thiobacillaceae bacterium]|nr:TA system VapC family ribonuclease toxin [Thiobacillaceae bacterium]